jgi:hypothetical protein
MTAVDGLDGVAKGLEPALWLRGTAHGECLGDRVTVPRVLGEYILATLPSFLLICFAGLGTYCVYLLVDPRAVAR